MAITIVAIEYCGPIIERVENGYFVEDLWADSCLRKTSFKLQDIKRKNK